MSLWKILECSPSLSHFSTEGGLVSVMFLVRLYNEKLKSLSIHLYCCIISVVLLCALHGQTVMGRKSPFMWFGVILYVSTCQPIVAVALSTFMWSVGNLQDNSLFPLGIQDVLKVVLGSPFLFRKRSFLSCVTHICRTNKQTHLRREMMNDKTEGDCRKRSNRIISHIWTRQHQSPTLL